MGRRDKIALGLTLVAVIVIRGWSTLPSHRPATAPSGSVVWAVGYGSGALFIWYAYIRPLDIRAPESVEAEEE